MKRFVIIVGMSPYYFSHIIKSMLNSNEFKKLGFKSSKVIVGNVFMGKGHLHIETETIKKVVLIKDDIMIKLLNGFGSSAVPRIDDIKSVELILLVGLCISFNDEIKIKHLVFPDKFTLFNANNNSFSKPLRLKNELIGKLGKGHFHVSVLTSPFSLFYSIPEINGDKLKYFKRLYARYDVGEMESALIAEFAKRNGKRFGAVLSCSDDRFNSITNLANGLTLLLRKAITKVLGTAPDLRINNFNSYYSFVDNLYPKYSELIFNEYDKLINESSNYLLKKFDSAFIKSLINNVLSVIKIILNGELS